MTNLPPIPNNRDWSEATWRAGWNEACKRSGCFGRFYTLTQAEIELVAAHATTLLDDGIVKTVVSEGAVLLEKTFGGNAVASTVPFWKCPVAIAVIQAALDKARNGQ